MKKIYNYKDEPTCAYLLKNGTVYFEIKEKELYKISGKNLIVGAGEIILNRNPEKYHYRAYSFYSDDNTELAEISPANLNKLVYNYSVGYNMNIFFAQMIKITNKILAKRQHALTDDVKIIHEISKAYFEITNQLLNMAQKTKFPDIIQLSEKHKAELIYETGKIFSQQKSAVQLSVKKEILNEFNISFDPGSVICTEGEEGNDMYVLDKGRIGVFIGDNQVAEISQPGTVIGEIALLLGETRTATLKSLDQVSLSVIKKENMKDFFTSHISIFMDIGETLSKRINNNFQMIHKIDQQEKEKHDQKVAGFLTRNRAEIFLTELEKNISDVYRKKDYEQLKGIAAKADKYVEKYIKQA